MYTTRAHGLYFSAPQKKKKKHNMILFCRFSRVPINQGGMVGYNAAVYYNMFTSHCNDP